MPRVEALVLGLDPKLAHCREELDDRVEAVLEHRLEDEVLAAPRVLRVVHRAHVQGGDVRLQLAEIRDALVDRDSDRPGRVVDDHIVDLGPDRLGDRAEVLDLVARDALRRARVDVDLRTTLVDDPPSLGGVLLGRVGNRRALVAIGDCARDRAADDDGILEVAHTGITPCFFHGRWTRLFAAIRRPRMIVGRVSRGSIMSSIRSLWAAM